MRKFKSVELIPALARIMHNNTKAYQGDYLYYDVDAINESAKYAEQNGTPVYMMWLSRKDGTHLFSDRSVFIKGTADYNTWLGYLQSESEQVKAFALKITGQENGHPIGDIYELDNERQAAYIKVLDYPPVKTDIFFKSGQIKSYDYEDYNKNYASIAAEYGPALNILHRPENEDNLQAVLRVSRGMLEDGVKEYPISKYFKEIEAGHWHGVPYPIDGKDTTDPSMTDSDRRLCQKAKSEYESYLNSVRRMSPDDIIMEAPKLAAMRQLLHLIQVNTLSDMERDALLTLNEPLSCIYYESRDAMEDSVIDSLRFGIKEQAGLCQEYLESGEYYRNKDDLFSEEEVGGYTEDYHPDILQKDTPYEPDDGVEMMDDD